MTTLDTTPGTTAEPDLPFHLRGNYAPVTQEVSATDPAVTGDLPPELCGRFFRNGPTPRERPVPRLLDRRSGIGSGPPWLDNCYA